MHTSVLLTLAAAAGALAGPMKRETTSSATYACNPAHSYPGGAQCVSTNGALTLVTSTASSSAKACKKTSTATTPAAVSITPTPAASSAVKPASSSAKSCKASSKATTTAAAASSAAASSSAKSAASAAATPAPSAGETKAAGLTWTVKDLNRYCKDDKSGCDYSFSLAGSDNRPAVTCSISRSNVKDAPDESWSNIPCTANSPINVSWGYSVQFGADNAFAVMTVVDNKDKEMAYFGVSNINSRKVAGKGYGSGQYGDVGPQPVYHF